MPVLSKRLFYTSWRHFLRDYVLLTPPDEPKMAEYLASIFGTEKDK